MQFSREVAIQKITKKSWAGTYQKGDLLLTQIIDRTLQKQDITLRDAEVLYGFLQDNNIFENFILGYVKGADIPYITLHRDPLLHTIQAISVTSKEKIPNKNQNIAYPFSIGFKKTTPIKLSQGVFAYIIINESFGNLKEKYIQKQIRQTTSVWKLNTKIYLNLIKYTNDDTSDIGTALSELLPLLEEIDNQTEDNNQE